MTEKEADRALLQAAANVAGLDVHIEADGTTFFRGRTNNGLPGKWNPLEDTDQAVQLAIRRNISVTMGNGTFVVKTGTLSSTGDLDDDGAALRRAIVSAVARG